MSAIPLVARKARALQQARPTFDVDSGLDGPTPRGFTRLEVSGVLLRRDFQATAADLFEWRMHGRAGLRVAASQACAEVGTVVLMRFGPLGVGLQVPCRVVGTTREDGRAGFAYVTLPGHPECGAEWFMLHRDEDEAIRFTITAISRPQSRLARLSPPVGQCVQYRMTLRYLHALDQLA